MFEGKHIHFSPTDNKPLCSYSGKLCRQRRLNGYAFCIRHILEDRSAPFKQCSYVTRNNSQKCLNAIPTNQDRGYCHSHMQVIGIIPKTERKSKIQSVSKADSNSNSSTTDKLSSPTLPSLKKDPGAVFKFEEESSDVTNVFSYKNGLSAGNINGKGKSAKVRDVGYNSSKDSKNVKPQNGFSNKATANFTTKKITDKNKNVYTAVIPASSCVNNTTTKNKVYPSKNKSTCWSNVATDPPSVETRNHKTVTRFVESELKNLYDDEEFRQFEQLKTLNQLDKSSLSSEESIEARNGENAKLQVFPRLAVPKHKLQSLNSIPQICSSPTSSSPVTNHPIPDDTKSQSCTEKDNESEIASNSPPPPLVTHSNNNSIIVKTELPQAAPSVKNETGMDNASDITDSVEKKYSSSDRGVRILSGTNNNYSNPIVATNDHCISIEKDMRNRHEFLAHVRHSFKSQYKSIKKSCKFSERSEKNGKQKLRNSLMRCVRIDSSVCAQILMGYGIKLPTLCSSIKIESEGKKEVDRKNEFDDYEFVDNESALPALKNDNTVSEQKRKKGNSSSKSSKIGTNKTSQKQSATKGKELEVGTIISEEEKKDNNKCQYEATKESRPRIASLDSASKRKLKRADAILVSPETSLGSSGAPIHENVSSSNNTIERVDTAIVKKKQRLELNVITPLETELGLTLNEETSHDDRVTSSDHQNLTQTVCKAINDSNHEFHDILGHSQLSSSTSHRNEGLETVLNSVGSSENAGTPDGVITDASFDSTFEHSTSSQPECEFSEDDLEHSFELQIDPEIESQASRLLEDNVLTEADFTELFPDNRMSDHKFGRNDLQELGMTGLEFDVNDIDYSLFANIFPNFPRTSQPESISISNQF